jgi:hypothetical protein
MCAETCPITNIHVFDVLVLFIKVAYSPGVVDGQ